MTSRPSMASLSAVRDQSSSDPPQPRFVDKNKICSFRTSNSLMAPKEFSVLDQKSSHVFDLIGESINKPQFIHLCLNILLLLGQEFGVRMFPEFESVSKYLSSSERLSSVSICQCRSPITYTLREPPRSAQSILAS